MPAEPRILTITDNLRAAMWRADDNPKAVVIYFQAREREEPISFRVITTAPILSSFWKMPSLRGSHWLTLTESRGTHDYAVALADHMFLDEAFIIGLELDTDSDPQDHVTAAEIWNKADSEPQIIYVENVA